MPKSKNTRKKAYRPRQVKIGPYWPADQQADVEDKLTKVALYVESTLPTGAATEQQIDWIEDVFIWFLGMLYKRHRHLDRQEVSEAGRLAMDGKHALEAIMKQLDKVTLNLGILFGNAKKGPWTPYSQDCRRSRHD